MATRDGGPGLEWPDGASANAVARSVPGGEASSSAAHRRAALDLTRTARVGCEHGQAEAMIALGERWDRVVDLDRRWAALRQQRCGRLTDVARLAVVDLQLQPDDLRLDDGLQDLGQLREVIHGRARPIGQVCDLCEPAHRR